MGKSYKAKTEIDYLDDMFEEDPDIDLDFEDDIDVYLSRQMSGSGSKRNKGGRASKRSNGYDDIDMHRLPRDWQDFDYAPDSHIRDDWR